MSTGYRPALKRPPEKWVRLFQIGQVGNDTVGTFLEQGFSLGIACKNCPRTIEWTPPELQERFSDKLTLKIADLVPRLRCNPPEGCGHDEVAVFPHLYDGE